MRLKIVGIGEVLWDLLPAGPQLGGAPANFAYHAQALGARAHAITRVGDDDLGREVIRRFQEMGLRDGAVQTDPSAPTGTARVALSGDGLAHFTIQENVAWDYITATEQEVAIASDADAVCFGSLAQRNAVSRSAIGRVIASAPPDALRVFDINLRQQFYSKEVIEESLQRADVLKLNDEELPILARMFSLKGSPSEIEHQMEQLARGFSLRVVALTRGANGSLLYRKQDSIECWSDCSSRPVLVSDTVGAGDSFTAALVLGLLQGMELDEINSVANEVARYVCSQPGATPRLPAEFAKRFAHSA